MKEYRLIIFDIDDTLVPFNETELLPGVAEKLRELDCNIALVTNQGGPACRDAGWPWSHKFPTMLEVADRLRKVVSVVSNAANLPVPHYISWAYVSKDNKVYYPKGLPEAQRNLAMRKPQPGMLLKAMADAGVAPSETLMVGDREEDQEAAENARTDFMRAKEFFDGS